MKTYARLIQAENECTFHVTRVQITKSACKHSKFLPSWFSVMLFSFTLLTSNNMTSLAIWCNKHWQIFQRLQIALALYAFTIFLSWKSTWNHVITYTNFYDLTLFVAQTLMLQLWVNNKILSILSFIAIHNLTFLLFFPSMGTINCSIEETSPVKARY